MADHQRLSGPERNAMGLDLEISTTTQVSQHGHITLPSRPTSAVISKHNGDMNEKTAVMSGTCGHRDVEKQAMDLHARPEMAETHNPYFAGVRYDDQSTVASNDHRLVDQCEDLNSKALKILLFLSGPCVFLSGLLCIWSLVATFALVFTYPFRLFSKTRSPLSDELMSTLARSNRFQLRAIYSFTGIHGKSIASLLLVHILSPFLAIGIAIAAWAVAIYWIFAAMIGDPDGSEGEHDDGRSTVLGLRKYWEAWLCTAVCQ